MDGRYRTTDHDCGLAVRGLEVFALFEVICRNEFVQVRVPEQVAGGGVDDLGASLCLDGEVVEVGVVVDQDGGDGLRAGLCGLRVSGEDLVAGLELADRDGLA